MARTVINAKNITATVAAVVLMTGFTGGASAAAEAATTDTAASTIVADTNTTVADAQAAIEKAEAEAKAKAEAEAKAKEEAAAQAQAQTQAATATQAAAQGTATRGTTAQAGTTQAATNTGNGVNYNVNVNCSGGQAQIDTCTGATNYTPVSDYLGVPYYAQHSGMGGSMWYNYKVGDRVNANGRTYVVIAERIVYSGGDVAQIAGMGGDAYLQTCINNTQSRVLALRAI